MTVMNAADSRAGAHLQPIELVLPYPLSANRYWRTYMPKGFKAPVTVYSVRCMRWLCSPSDQRSRLMRNPRSQRTNRST